MDCFLILVDAAEREPTVLKAFSDLTGENFRGQGHALGASRLDHQVEKRSDKKNSQSGCRKCIQHRFTYLGQKGNANICCTMYFNFIFCIYSEKFGKGGRTPVIIEVDHLG